MNRKKINEYFQLFNVYYNKYSVILTECFCIFVTVYLFHNKRDEAEQISYQF
jgi:hypothetical protein